MTNRIGPMDQGSIGKLGNKAEEAGVSRATGDSKPGASQSASPSSSSSFTDTVNLTSGGQLLSRLEQSLATAPSVDASRVADVKAAITNGNYEIDSGAIADAMIRFEQSLGE